VCTVSTDLTTVQECVVFFGVFALLWLHVLLCLRGYQCSNAARVSALCSCWDADWPGTSLFRPWWALLHSHALSGMCVRC
jgi:hypothetical protein